MTTPTRPRDLSRRHLLKAGVAAGAALAAPVAFAAPRAAPKAAAKAPSLPAAQRLSVAFIGLGGRSRTLLKEYLGYGHHVAALCDVDSAMVAEVRKAHPDQTSQSALYEDYRKLLAAEKQIDGVVIATPDHWHAPICRAAIQAGKHVYCEKPLTRTIGEARDLRTLVKSSKAVTQLGNQGGASTPMRRCVELMRAGALGQVTDMHAWLPPAPGTPYQPVPLDVADPVPAGFNWDLWVGPSPLRPYKKDLYHPRVWRRWYDFGCGSLGDFGCHAFNLPLRGLALDYPDRVEILAARTSEKGRYPTDCRLKIHFPPRGKLAPFTIHWYDSGALPPKDVVADVLAVYKELPRFGCLFVGDKGTMYTDSWNKGGLVKLAGEPRLKGVLNHEATRHIPETLPRVQNHMEEWTLACKGGPKTFSDFEIGGHLTEIALAGVLALRLGRELTWDGATMTATDAPEAGPWIKPEYRSKWLG